MEQTKGSVTFCYVAGHSGGHIIPCLTLAAQAKQKNTQISVMFFSGSDTLDQTIVHNTPIVHHHHTISLTRKRSWFHLPLLALQLARATAKTFFIFVRNRPSRVVSTGSIVAVPVVLASWILRIQIDLYELNAVPGSTIKALAPLADTIYVCFANAKNYFPNKKCVVTAYPIRFEHTESKILAPSDRLTIFVHGGSQGSQFINTQIKTLIETYPDLNTTIQLIHQTGPDKSVNWATFYKDHTIPAHVFSYDSDVARYYNQADLIICRSGAGTLFEALHFKKPCITIPLETKSTSHQLNNAQAIIKEHPQLFTMIRQGDDVVGKLYQIIKNQCK